MAQAFLDEQQDPLQEEQGNLKQRCRFMATILLEMRKKKQPSGNGLAAFKSFLNADDFQLFFETVKHLCQGKDKTKELTMKSSMSTLISKHLELEGNDESAHEFLKLLQKNWLCQEYIPPAEIKTETKVQLTEDFEHALSIAHSFS